MSENVVSVQIGLDDLSPRPTQSWETWEYAEYLMDHGFKVDIFVPFALRRGDERPYYLSEHDEFMDRLYKEYRKRSDSMCLHVHGLYHSASIENPNHEFFYCSVDEASNKLKSIRDYIDTCQVPFIRNGTLCFRPPGWKINQAAIDGLNDNGFTHLCLLENYKNQYKGLNFRDLNVHWCNATPPEVALPNDDIKATYHFSTRLKNALNYTNVNSLLEKIGHREIKAEFIIEQ